ncbi:MAG: hypothetical protein IK117_09415 [Bacteroidales bacterium]|nr:hypothetical protein [Bacteroidales bacterium]
MRKLLLILTIFCGFSLMSLAQNATIDKPKVEAKKLTKEGYDIMPDALHPMKKQLEFAYEKQLINEKNSSLKYFIVIGTASDASLVQAKTSAREKAVQQMLKHLMSQMKSIIEKNGGIQEKGSTVAELLSIVEEKCKQKMISGPILADFYKKVNGKYTVKRYCTYNYKDAQTMAIDYFESELKNESEKLKSALRNPANWH